MLVTPEEVAQDRAWIEENLIDRGRVTREGRPGDPGYHVPVFNNETGQYDEPPRVTVYEGRCRVQVRADINSNAVEAAVGDHEWTYRTSIVQFPIYADATKGDAGDTGAILPDHQLEVLESPLDSRRVATLINLQADTKNKTQASHRRFRGRELLA